MVSVKPGDVFRADCREWFDGATENDDSADDVRYALLPGVHALTGPFRVEGGVLTYKGDLGLHGRRRHLAAHPGPAPSHELRAKRTKRETDHVLRRDRDGRVHGHLHVDVITGGMEKYGVYENAIFMPGLRDPQNRESRPVRGS